MDVDYPTWADVDQLVKEAHLDQAEYFSARNMPDSVREKDIWERGNPFAYWLKGGSEGWYVHVGQRRWGGQAATEHALHEDLLLGKFWTPEDAAFAADLLTRFMNGEFRSYDELVAEGRERFPKP